MTQKSKPHRGGGSGFLNLLWGFIGFVLAVVGDVFLHLADFLYNHSVDILGHLVFLFAYVLAFYYVQFKTTEIPSVILLFVLHMVFLGLILAIKIKLPIFDLANNVGSFTIYIASVGWIFIFVAFCFLLKVYTDLYNLFVVNAQTDISFGVAEPTKQRFLNAVFYSAVFMWAFYVLEHMKTSSTLILSIMLFLFALFLVLTVICWYSMGAYLWGTVWTVVAFLVLVLLKYVNEAEVDVEDFFTKNPIFDNLVLLTGIVFDMLAMYTYNLSTQIATYTQSVSLPRVLQMNAPGTLEQFIVEKKIDGKMCKLDSQDKELFEMLKNPDAETMKTISQLYCAPTPKPTKAAVTPETRLQDSIFRMLGERDITAAPVATATAQASAEVTAKAQPPVEVTTEAP